MHRPQPKCRAWVMHKRQQRTSASPLCISTMYITLRLPVESRWAGQHALRQRWSGASFTLCFTGLLEHPRLPCAPPAGAAAQRAPQLTPPNLATACPPPTHSLQVKEYSDQGALVLFSGDAYNPSIMSTILGGKQMVAVLNQLGVHAACLGA